MRKLWVAVVILAVMAGCSKNESEIEAGNEGECALTVDIAPSPGAPAGIVSGGVGGSTKAIGAGHGVQDDDNKIQTLEIFVFKNVSGAADDGALEVYKKFSGTPLTTLTGLQLRARTGPKIIVAIANSHAASWAGIDTYSEFQTITSSLKAENLTTFVMTGSATATLAATASVSIPISRLVGRVILSSIKTNFAGTPYEGSTLSDVKIYLTNVSGCKLFYSGGETSSAVILNAKQYVSTDCNGCAMSGMLYDDVAGTIGEAAVTTAHYFYCYENMLAAETTSERFTRMVIQATLAGKVYYYPVDINREGYGWVSANGHVGVKRNTSYSVSVAISGPGSTTPDEPITRGTLTTDITVSNWATVPDSSVNF
ncbi:MAG TPA: fimbrial protein [Candidatus Egerieousia sp.]|nr:fimbrial protein [Candidatus Egerieousia sp.]HPT05953.1 fimbrial protein [Candidatus Egerieousia sp.]